MPTTKHRYVDCQGLGGHWTYGTLQTGGFNLVHRASLGAFGDSLVEANRHLITGDWEQDSGDGLDEWTPVQEVAYLNGTPPCSGFSLLNNSAASARKHGKEVPATARGPESAINSCMWELIRYAARCTGPDGEAGPPIVAYESVQGAFKAGEPLMTMLLAELRNLTGQNYQLTHVLMSGSSVGAAQMRHRYYPVFHRIPFGVDAPEPRKVVTYEDALGDLIGANYETWDEQPVPGVPSEWLQREGMLKPSDEIIGGRTQYVIDSHIGIDNTRSRIFLEDLYPYWKPGESLTEPLARYIKANGRTPLGAERWWDFEASGKDVPKKIWDQFQVVGNRRGFSGPRRIFPDRPGYVLTGGGIFDYIHWQERRFLTVRECARLMGLPDTWVFKDVARGVNQASSWIGKCCPVQSGRWISQWILEALNGNPGTYAAPHPNGNENERYFNCTLDYKRWPKEISEYTGK